MVHAAAVEIVDQLWLRLPNFRFDLEAALFGSEIHDLGKVLHPDELKGPGRRQEDNGPALLESLGVPLHLSRFARTHGTWDQELVEIEDLLVALADEGWKGQRAMPLKP